MEGYKKRKSVAKCRDCFHEWKAIDTGQPRPSRCTNCKSRNVDWRRDWTEEELNSHMPLEKKSPDAVMEKVEKVEKVETETQPEVETVEKTPEISNVEKPEDTSIQPKQEENEVIQKVEKPKEEVMPRKKTPPATKRVEKVEKVERIDNVENPEDFFNPFGDYPYDPNDTGWKQAKASTPKINPAGIVLLLGAAAAVAGVVFFLKKNPNLFSGKIHAASNRQAVQAPTRPRPITLDTPRLGGML